MYPRRSGVSSEGASASSPNYANRSKTDSCATRSCNSRLVSPSMCRRTTLPVPGHVCASRSARTDSVRMKRPGLASSSTARFTAPRASGTTCHSSRSTGSASPRRAASESARNAAASASRSNRTIDAATRRALVVLPAARGPTISTAGSSRIKSKSGVCRNEGHPLSRRSQPPVSAGAPAGASAATTAASGEPAGGPTRAGRRAEPAA